VTSTVVVGGLASTLILTLLAVPALYWLAERFRKERPRAIDRRPI